jgi:hypothetical protein
MDSIIHNRASKSSVIMTADEINQYIGPNTIKSEKLYFFFKTELDLPVAPTWTEYNKIKAEHIRHMIPYKGKYFDYVVHQEYDTLNDWAVDNGKTLDDIVYGVNFVYRVNAGHEQIGFVTLETLIKHLEPSFQFNVKNEEFARIQTELEAIISRIQAISDKLKSLA